MAIPYSRTVIGTLPWYSVLVVCGIALAVWLAGREEKRLGLPADTAVDLALAAVPCGVVGARLYYVLMRWDVFAADPISALYVWNGGLAIYGAVIGGAVSVWIYARKKKLSFASLTDMLAPGLLLAQAVGRWGNYFNMEAYGPAITEPAMQFFPLAVLIPHESGYVWHAATFFYESVWNALGFAALWGMRKKLREKGSVFAWYLLIYGAGRFIIEQLRQDSLYIGSLRASQYLSRVLCVAAAVALLWRACRKPGVLAASGLIFVLWAARWMALEQYAAYALLMVLAGMAALWLQREERSAVIWLLAVFLLDGTGLLLSMMMQSAAARGIHALMCSVTLPMGVYALCAKNK